MPLRKTIPIFSHFFLFALIVGQILWPVGIKYWASYNRF